MRKHAAALCASLIAGCAMAPTQAPDPALVVVTPDTATSVGFESSGLAERRAKQGTAVPLELRPEANATTALEPRFTMSSTVEWRERKWEQTGWRKAGRLVDETRYPTANEWSADNGALAWAELHESCVRLAQQVRAQVDPENRVTLVRKP